MIDPDDGVLEVVEDFHFDIDGEVGEVEVGELLEEGDSGYDGHDAHHNREDDPSVVDEAIGKEVLNSPSTPFATVHDIVQHAAGEKNRIGTGRPVFHSHVINKPDEPGLACNPAG